MTEMPTKAEPGMISEKEAEEQVVLMASRLALMYHHIGQVLTEELGMEKAKELLKEAIWRYGAESGEKVRAGVEAMGLPLTAENYNKVPDLPRYGWVSEQAKDGPRVSHCPLAAVWLEKGSTELGRIYCFVDQAKFEAYGNLECVHLKNLNDGDDCCLFSIKPRD